MLEDGEFEANESKINYKAIACEQIPELFLDKIVAKKHFSKFGKIKRFILKPKRLSCTVEYESRDDAENAYMNAGNFNGTEFVISYAEYEVAHVQNTEEWVDADVQAELEAMSPGHKLGTHLRTSSSGLVQPLQKSNPLNRVSKTTHSFSAPLPKFVKVLPMGRQEIEQSENTKFDGMIRNELEAILKIPAFTDEEKYRVLDARDKLIRLTTVRQTDIKKAVATKGTCPDMCPEKERLMREFQRQVSIFEMAEDEGCESTISHKKAVKEYSRSSADQEVPLSHELRSESVLQMTMLYLVHRIMGLCDDPKTSLGDWFHFVWDRTRSIRKDITQQELCSLGAVQLVEQCARFHIHCAARLVAEDPSVFDKKINAENLTKCLQTLKYMYHDLRIKGVLCPCEAEFRSYVILLNLGDSNFLWEVKQLPDFIQKSTQIKQAIAFYNALQNNNFVRFFSMVKSAETSYLSACILLGYFTKLRVRAMDAIIKSHNWRKNDVYLPLPYLTRVLGFDDESSAASFFSHYGLQCDLLHKRVLLDRLSKPDNEYAMERALQLVESKRQVSVGECVFGQTLPPPSLFENHKPHNSFDNNGMLKIESWTADDQLKGKIVKSEDQNKEDQKLQYKNVSSYNDKNLFKVPQSLASDLPKPRKQQEQKLVIETQTNVLGDRNGEKHFPCGLNISGNIFGVTTPTTSSTESIFELSSYNKESQKNNNTFMNTLLQSSTKRTITNMGNIFGVISTNNESKNANIFGTAAIETANIFQQQNYASIDHLKNDKVFQLFQSDKNILNISHLETEVEHNNFKSNEIDTKNASLKEQLMVNFEKNQDEKEVQNLREKEDQSISLEKQRVEQLKIKIIEKAKQEFEKMIIHLVEDEVTDILQAEIRYLQMVVQASDMQKDLIISEVVNVCVEDIANEEYALMCHDQLLLNRYFSRWLLHLRKKKQQRKLMENTPLWVTTNTRAHYAKALKHPCQQKNLEMIKRYRMGQPCDFNDILKMEHDILYEKNKNPLNLFALVGQHLLPKVNITSSGLLQQRKYFKFLISLPENKEELLGFESFFNKWLNRYIESAHIDSGPFVNGIEHNVALCVRKLIGIIPKNEQGDEMTTEGDHNDGVVCFITGIDVDAHSRRRLYNLLKLTKNLKRIPLAIIAYNCNYNKEELAKILCLDILQKEGLIYSYLIVGCQVNRKDFSFRKLFIKAVDFITKESYSLNSNEIQALAMQNLRTFLENSLGEEMWQRWCESANKNPIFNKICSLPKHIVGIFHKALDHLLYITQEDLHEMPEFPEELKKFVPETTCSNMPLGLEFFPVNWKNETNRNILKNFLESLYLPYVDEKLPIDIEDLKLWLLKYSSMCIKDDVASTKASYEAITNLICQINHHYKQNVELTSCINMINYLTVMKPIIFARINSMLKHFHNELLNLNVIFLKDDLKNYQTQPWWLNYEPIKFVSIDYTSKTSNLPQTLKPKNKENCVPVDEIEKILANAETTSRNAENMISKYRKLYKSKIPCTNLPSSLELKRTLDDSLYKFELSKKIGEYDTSFVADLTRDIDKSIDDVIEQSSPRAQKRKRSDLISPNRFSDIDNVLAKATNLIKKIEHMEDQKFKIKKMF